MIFIRFPLTTAVQPLDRGQKKVKFYKIDLTLKNT